MVIEFVGSAAAPTKRVSTDAAADLVDLCDQVLAPIPFSCRSASCGTCHVEVLEGLEHLAAPNPDEAELLDILGGPPNARLACQARVCGGPGLVRIRSLSA